jgi:catechol 2,3-dioxygenase-like lactoylglutathione lyase family enzyme
VNLDPLPLSGAPDQVGLLVPDLDLAMAALRAAAGFEPWMLNTMHPGRAKLWRYRASPGSFSMRAALFGQAPQVELLQPLDGPSIYHEWAERGRWGLHHLGYFVDDLDVCIERMAALGREVIQEGRGYGLHGDGGYAYFDGHPDLHTMVEAIERPAERRRPDGWWPAPLNPAQGPEQ